MCKVLVCILVNPTQIFCKHYLYLMEQLQPIQVSKMLYYKRIFSYYDLDAILSMPIDHMKSLYILEYYRLMGATGILEFIDILNIIGSQKEISNILRNGEMIEPCTFTYGTDLAGYISRNGTERNGIISRNF